MHVMSNHYHLVLRINQEVAKQWSVEQVIEQWEKLDCVPVLVARYRRGETTSHAENLKAEEIIETWRERLMDISWFMRSLNEFLAKRANQEDNCTGHYYEAYPYASPLRGQPAAVPI